MTNGMNRPAPREYSVEESVLKELIKREMLDAAGNPHAVQRVFDRYEGSRIPLYTALGEVNVELRGEHQRLAWKVAVAQADARKNGARVRVRKETVDIDEQLLAKGVKETDVIDWAKEARSAGRGPSALLEAITEFGSLEGASEACRLQVTQLGEEVEQLEHEVEALKRERGNIQAGIRAVRTRAELQLNKMCQRAVDTIQEMGSKANAAVDEIAGAGASCGLLREEAAVLKEYVEVARALRSADPDEWAKHVYAVAKSSESLPSISQASAPKSAPCRRT